MPPQLDIREAAEEDAPALAALLAQLGYPDTEGFVADRIAQQRSHPDALMLGTDRATRNRPST